MKRHIWNIAGLGVMSLFIFSALACSPVGKANAIESQAPDNSAQSADGVMQSAGPSCANPTAEMLTGCQAQAERVLASTVRLEFHGPGDIGHATVVGGRYLITHNHYSVSGEALSRGDGLISAVSVLKANGEIILLKAPLSYFSVAAIGPEMLALDFHEYNGVGFFDGLGVPSAETASVNDLTIQPGSEVAQIDWDMTTTRVTWAKVTAVYVEGDAPYVELDSFVEQGASGGGVFYNGYHIANNWSRNTDRNPDTGDVLRQYSLAALNTGYTASFNVDMSEVAFAGN